MKIQFNLRTTRESGYTALFITLILVGACLLMLGATANRTMSGSKLNDRNVLYVAGGQAAEAAVEKVLARMMVDYGNGGETLVISNINYYETSMLPTTNENPYWGTFRWSDAQGNLDRIYVARTTTASNASFVALEQQYAGLSGYASTYRILANVTPQSSTYNYNFTNAVAQDVQLAQIPVFQFAIFYNSLLEFSDTATLTVRGLVHANSNIYVGSPANLTFMYPVTATGNITKAANDGYSVSSWTGSTTYSGQPSPGYLTGQPTLTLPIGTNNSADNVRAILYPPPAGELSTSIMGQQRYINKANLIVTINANSTLSLIIRNSATDAGAVTITNWPYVSSWLTISNSSNTGPLQFYDFREKQYMNTCQIDVSKLTNWMNTNVYIYDGLGRSNVEKFSYANPVIPCWIVYVIDYRPASLAANQTNTCVRLVNGQNLPSIGLTFATPEPLYIWGNYNCPTANLGTTNTTLSAGASFVSDAITILSPHWTDVASSTVLTSTSRDATDDTVNAAMITGIVYSTGTTSTTFSGGVENYPRLLEDWSAATLTLNTSMVCFYNSIWVDNQFVNPGTYYNAPKLRNFNFDQNYMSSAKMPPGTPNVCRLIRADWVNPKPGSVTDMSSPTLDFVAQ